MARKRNNPDQRDNRAGESASGRCYRDMYGTTKVWNIWAVAKRAVNEGDFGPLEELQSASEHAVCSVIGHVPPGAKWSGYNALIEKACDINPFVAIRRLFLRGEGKKDIYRKIRERIDSKKKK